MKWLLLVLLLLPVEGAEVVRRALEAVPPARGEVLEPLYPVGDCRLPAAPTEWRTSARGDTVRVEARAGGRLLRAWNVVLRRKPLRDCLVATRSLRRGEVLEAGALRPDRRPEAGLAFLPPEEAHGRYRLRRDLPAGQPLRLSDLEPLPAVAAGEALTVRIRSGGVTVLLEARAREAGYAGRPLRVRTAVGDERTVWVQADGTVTAERGLP